MKKLSIVLSGLLAMSASVFAMSDTELVKKAKDIGNESDS